MEKRIINGLGSVVYNEDEMILKRHRVYSWNDSIISIN